MEWTQARKRAVLPPLLILGPGSLSREKGANHDAERKIYEVREEMTLERVLSHCLRRIEKLQSAYKEAEAKGDRWQLLFLKGKIDDYKSLVGMITSEFID